jgi:alpha-tubulin suppressor-like RCC1 family protein
VTVPPAVAVGFGFACGIDEAGGAMCWGKNAFGTLGNGTTTDSALPVQVTGLTSGVTAISAGAVNACALLAGGSVVCWGNNGSGQLGNGTTTDSAVPVQVTGLTSGVTSMSVGDNTACAVTASGGAVCWGLGMFGELGNGGTANSSVPVPVTGLTSGIARVSVGGATACALTTGGAVQCWGNNGFGTLGDDFAETQSAVPVQVIGLTSGVVAISNGGAPACAILTGGAVQCWGTDIGTNNTNGVPVPKAGLANVTALGVGNVSACAILAGGALECWGDNSTGQLGNGTTTSTPTPGAVTGLSSGVTSASVNSVSGCAVTSAGTVQCWGEGTNGELGNGTTTSSLVPVLVVGFP